MKIEFLFIVVVMDLECLGPMGLIQRRSNLLWFILIWIHSYCILHVSYVESRHVSFMDIRILCQPACEWDKFTYDRPRWTYCIYNVTL